MRTHHATAASAQKQGFTVVVADTNDHAIVSWPERNKKLVATDPKQGVADMAVLKMLTLEYPELKVVQEVEEGEWDIFSGKGKSAENVGRGDTLQDAWEQAADAVAGDDAEDEEFEEDVPADEVEEEEPEDAGKSIVKPMYKVRYKPHHMTCGDDLAKRISDYLTVKDEDGRKRIDPDLLREFAKANDVWVPSYAGKNIGQQRMNIGNRLRAKVRKEAYEIVWA